MKTTLLLILLSVFSAASADAPDKELLTKFQDAGSIRFPKFTKAEIPKLLKLAKDETTMECPANPLSSRHIGMCSTGVVALWAIEGIRQGGKYPSLNPVLTDSQEKIKDEKLLLFTARKKYELWWNQGAKGEPLKGSTIKWR